MNLEPIAELIEMAGFGIRGQSIFIAHFPVNAKMGTLLRARSTGTKIDYELPGFYKTDFTVIVRSQKYQDGDALIKVIMTALTILETQLSGSFFVKYLRPCTTPQVFPLSDGAYFEMAVKFDICFVQ